MPHPYTIGRLAAAAGVHIETIRYYQRQRLVTEPSRPLGGIRRYTEADADRLRFIKRAQAMGFTLLEVKSLLKLQARRSCHATRELAATKLRLVDARICELRDLRKELAGLIADCDANAEDAACPVIERLSLQSAERQVREPHGPARRGARRHADP
jgi:MerR family mercuric resistance operon transcriptional regulator